MTTSQEAFNVLAEFDTDLHKVELRSKVKDGADASSENRKTWTEKHLKKFSRQLARPFSTLHQKVNDANKPSIFTTFSKWVQNPNTFHCQFWADFLDIF